MILARANVSIATGTLALGAEGQIYVSNNNSVHTGNTGQSMSISSVITGSNGLTYTGGWTGQGTLTLSGDDTYTGATTVNTGTLLVTGSLAGTSSVAINNTGVLGGGGMVGAVGATGTTSVNAGGEIYPGATLATAGTKLTINNNVIFNNGGTLAINLDATHDTVDLLAINGNLTLNGTDALTLDLVGGALTGAVNYEIATYTGTLSGAFVAPANLTSAGYQIDYSQPGEIFLDVAAIPEPGACAMFVCGIGALIGIQRSRRRQTRD
jgi:autotransporter-associated beta strand protein